MEPGQNQPQAPGALGSCAAFFFHPLVSLGACAVAGALSASAPLAAGSVGVVWLVCLVLHLRTQGLRRTHSRSPRLAHTRRRWIASSGWALTAVTALALFVLCHARASRALSAYQHRYHALHSQLQGPARCIGQGQVVSSPVARSRLESAGAPTALFQVRFDQLECNDVPLSTPIVARVAHPSLGLVRGDTVHAYTQLALPQLFRNPLLPSPWLGAARSGALLSGTALELDVVQHRFHLGALIDRFRARVRARILATYTPATAALGRALVLGESDLPDPESEAFRDSGLMHLLAVSGTHLVIFVVSVVHMLRALLVRVRYCAERFDVSRWSAAFGAVFSLLYADFAGGSGSAWRAAYMLGLVSGARALGMRWSGSTALGGSLLVGLLLDPLAPSDFSFLLSALATTGLIGLGQPLTRLCARGLFARGPWRPLVESLCATLASTVPCSPVLAMMSDRMTWAALIANVLAAPLGEVIALPACLLHTVVSPLPALEAGLASVGSGALYGVRAVALLSASSHFAQFAVPFPRPSSLAFAIAALLSILLLLSSRVEPFARRSAPGRHPALQSGGERKRMVVLAALFGAFLWGAHSRSGQRASGRLSVTALDVGQGDAIFVEFPGGPVALVDGGGFATGTPDTGARVLLPYLRSRGTTRLDLMVVSHAHPDHILGLLRVAEELPVGTLWFPDEGGASSFRPPPSLARLIALVRARGGRSVGSSELCQRPQELGGARVDILAPCLPSTPPLGLNDGSLVLRVRYGARAALLTGDIERTTEAHLVATRASDLRADLLKVAHHGSDTSSTAPFVRAVAPQLAFISSGVRNTFRHPRPGALATLSQAGAHIARTDRQGALSWLTDGHTTELRSVDPSPPR